MSHLVSTQSGPIDEHLDNEICPLHRSNRNELITPVHVEQELEQRLHHQRLPQHESLHQHQGLQQHRRLQYQVVHQEQLQRAPNPFPEPLQEEPESLDHLSGEMSEQDYQELQERHSKLSSLVVGMKARYRRHIENERRRMMIKVPLVVGGVIFGALGVVWYILRTLKIARTL